MKKTDYREYIENHTLRCEASYRGGGIEIDCSVLFDIPDAKMAAYQNYLGGGMLGSIQTNANFTPENKKQEKIYLALAEALKKYFHELTNHEGDEWESASYEENQNRPVSAY